MKETIVLYPSHGISHLVPMVELGKLITTHHPSFSIIILITTPAHNTNSTAPYINNISTTTPSINFHHLPTISLPSNSSYHHPEELAFELSLLNNPNFHQTLKSISRTSILKALVIDLFGNNAIDVAKILSIPTYYLFTSGASGLTVFLHLPTLKIHPNTIKSSNHVNTCLNIPGVPPIPTSDMPANSGTLHEKFMNAAIQMSKSKGIIVNTFESLETKATKAMTDSRLVCVPNAPTPPIFFVGPLIETNHRSTNGQHKCLTWLNSQPSRSVVFLCFGSMGFLSAKQLKEMAIGLEESGHRFLWVVRSPPTEDNIKPLLAPAEPDLDTVLPQGFVDRTRDRGLVVKSWAPQLEVLNHKSVGGFVTHCGWNSVLEAVGAGVPMVAWPLYAEQKMNRLFLVEEMKVALKLNELAEGFVSAAELEKRVRELMDSERGKEVRERAMAMRDGAVAAMGDGGSSRVALAKVAESWNRG